MVDAALRVLLVEYNPTDAALLISALKALNESVQVTRVQSAVSMVQALDQDWWDVVIVSHGVPDLSIAGALELVQARSLDLPFIVLSNACHEATVAPLMAQGVQNGVRPSARLSISLTTILTQGCLTKPA